MKNSLIRNKNMKLMVVIMAISFSLLSNAKTNPNKKKEALASLSSDQRSLVVKSPINRHSVGIGLGQTFLSGDMEDNGDDKITFDMYYSYSASYSFDLLINAHHTSHKYKNRKVKLSGLALGIKAKAFQFDNFSPFVTAGFGFYRPEVRRLLGNSIVNAEAKITFGNHIGVGADLKLNDRFTVGVIAHYHNPFDVKQEEGPEVEGSYSKLLLTGMYTF